MAWTVFTGSKIFNTLSNHSQCTVVFTAVTAIISIIVSLPRTLHHVAQMSIVSAISMGIALLLTWVYSGIEDHPTYGYGGNWPTLGPVTTTAGASPTTFTNGLNATLNVRFLLDRLDLEIKLLALDHLLVDWSNPLPFFHCRNEEATGFPQGFGCVDHDAIRSLHHCFRHWLLLLGPIRYSSCVGYSVLMQTS
jgi:hypothetical protein